MNHTRACSSNIGLCTLVRESQIASSPQYGEAPSRGSALADGVLGSRTGIRIWRLVWRTGSSTGSRSVLSSVAP
ncbi:MAG: hypothetical protein HY060_11575 [Proteobacteria bacterium]|nr:hypothetical protein [Pseudomonadota bacterium]